MIDRQGRYIERKCILAIVFIGISLFCGGLRGQVVAEPSAGYVDKVERGEVSFELGTTKSELSIADTFELTLTAKYPDGIKVIMPKLEMLLEGNDDFGVLDADKPESKLLDDGRTAKSVVCRIEPLNTGELELPELELEYYQKPEGDGDPEIKTLVLGGPKLLVTDIISVDGELNDIKGPVELPADHSKLIWMALGVFVVMVGLLAVVYFMSKRQLTEPAVVQRPAHEIALERLNGLMAENLLQQGKIKEFYEKLSYIIRLYIEHRYALRAPERTTEEFLQEAMSNPDMPEAFKDKLKEFLTHCDMVKFAKYAPTSDEITRSVDLARNFIESTASMG